jgi:hypothetical protein
VVSNPGNTQETAQYIPNDREARRLDGGHGVCTRDVPGHDAEPRLVAYGQGPEQESAPEGTGSWKCWDSTRK